MYSKRLWACLLGGILSAVICTVGAQLIFGSSGFTWQNAAARVANRLLLGFVIAISGWKINHLLHGAVLGLLLSLSVSLGFLPSGMLSFILFTAAGTVYGVLIEWLSTDIMKAPMRPA